MRLLKTHGVLICFCMGVCLWGGFYDFVSALFGCAFSIMIMLLGRKNKGLWIPKCFVTYGMALILVCGINSVYFADDKGMAWIGIVRIVTLIEFWLIWSNITEAVQEKMFNAIPASGTLATLISLPAFFIPRLQEYFYRANRLGGTFQYSNTYALFLLVGFYITVCKEKWRLAEKAEMVVLLVGILLTGSRSVFVLTVFTIIFVFCREKRRKKEKMRILVVSLLAVLLIQFFANLNLKRLLDITLNSSTLNGRLLYWQDALPVILDNPFGLGYMGYYFGQPQFQTGNYVTKFIHNDILQCALDNGILAAIVVICLFLRYIFNNKRAMREKGILILLLLHGMFDLDMQFQVLPCIALMCMKEYEKEDFYIKSRIAISTGLIMSCVGCYAFVALGMEHIERYEWSLKLYPWNTFAREELMLESEGERCYDIAQQIVEDNGMLASAYEYAMQNARVQGNYQAMLDYENQMLDWAGYENYYYNQAVYCLSIALDVVVREGDLETGQKLLGEIQSMSNRIKEKEKKASALAYRIYDKPQIVLAKEIEKYIESLSGINLDDFEH